LSGARLANFIFAEKCRSFAFRSCDADGVSSSIFLATFRAVAATYQGGGLGAAMVQIGLDHVDLLEVCEHRTDVFRGIPRALGKELIADHHDQ
jgi:hypothetical protein